MFPVLVKFGPLTIYSYGVALAVAVFIALSLLLNEAKTQGYDKDSILDLGMVLVVSSIVGARLLYIALNIPFFIEHPEEIIMLHHGGLAILGGFLTGIASVYIFTRKKKLSFLKIADLLVPFIALAHTIGRIGCFFNGCCYGIPSRYGFYFPVHNAVLIPTQLISSFLLLVLYVVLRIQQRRTHSAGSIFAAYIILYSALRFLVEFIRFDSPKSFFGLTIFQLFCIVFFIAGVFFAFRLKWKNKSLL